jgi:hypothetical protein
VQENGNGKAYSESTYGYKDSNYSGYTPKAFDEECEGDTGKACNQLFTTPCTTNESTPSAGCVPSGATVTTTNTACDKRVGTSGTCKWKRTDNCTISHACPTLQAEATRQGYGWSSSANIISYSSGAANATYTRKWNGSAWTPAAPTALKHSGSGTTQPEQDCEFKCYNEDKNIANVTARLKWNGSKCEVENSSASCATTCGDDHGGVYVNGQFKKCTVAGWKTVTQTIDISATGVATPNPASNQIDNPAYNSGQCSYQCENGYEHKGGSCKESNVSNPCINLPGGAVWAAVEDLGGGKYKISKASGTPAISSALQSDGTYKPDLNAYKTPVFANDSNIKSGSNVNTNQCYFMCAKNYRWNGSTCESAVVCGDGKIQTKNCSNTTGSALGKVTLSWGGKSKEYDCYYEPNDDAQEACDDGSSINGTYYTVALTGGNVSACKSDCSGRIKDGSEFFCGDKKVQVKSGTDTTNCSNAGFSCTTVTGSGNSQYPGPGFSGTFNTSEECDPNDPNIDTDAKKREKLCKAKFGNNTYYSAGTAPSCSTSNCTITATKGTNCQWCGDGVINGNETCDGNTGDLCNTLNTVTGVARPIQTRTWDFESSSSPYGKPAEVKEVVNGTFAVSWGGGTVADNIGLLFYMNGNDKDKSYHSKGSREGNGWTRQNQGSRNAYCSANAGNNYSMAELVLEFTTYETGDVSFDYYGGSESYGKGSCHTGSNAYMHDGFVAYLDKTSTYNGSNYYYNADLYSSGKCQSWTTKTFSNVSAGTHTLILRYFKDDDTDSNIDRYCIDNLKFKGAESVSVTSSMTCTNCQKVGTCYGYCGNGTVDSFGNGDLVYLKLDENGGSTATNYGSLGGSYSVSGGSFTSAAKRGLSAYTFNGSGGYIETANLKNSSYTNSFTMMAWVNPNASIYMPSGVSNSDNVADESHHFVFGAVPGHQTTPNQSNDWAGAGVSVGRNGVFVTAHSDNYFARLAYSSNSLNGWHHVAVVFSNKIPTIYIDGVNKTTKAISSAPSGKIYFPSYQIGGGQSTYGNFNGSVDDVRIIGKALSADEIKVLMGEECDDGSNNGKPGKCKPDCSRPSYNFTTLTASSFVTGISRTSWPQVLGSDTGMGTYDGIYAMCSNNSSNSSTATMDISVNLPTAGKISFKVKGTSENNASSDWDTFSFWVDSNSVELTSRGQNYNSSNGNITGWYDWISYTTNSTLSAGSHTLHFKYKKDGGVSNGTDRYCIDYLVFIAN